MSRIAIALLTFVCLIVSFGSLALAQTTIVQNRDEPGRNRYQEHAALSSNCGVNGCVASFAAIPTGQRVVVTFVSCWLLLPTGTSPLAVLLYDQTNEGERAYVPAIYQASLSNVGSWVASSPVVFYILSGDKPAVSVLLNGAPATSPGDCLLTGYHVALP